MNRFSYDLARTFAYTVFRVFFRLRRVGLDKLPKTGPVMIVGNHTSYFDPPLVGCCIPRRTYFFARSTLGKNRLIGRYLKSLGTLFVDRDGQARGGLDLGIGVLREDAVLTLFPEGTRSRDGRVGPFKRGLLLMLKKAPAQVVPAGIRGCHRAFPREGKLPRLFSPIEIHFGDPMTAAEVLAPGGLEELRRRVAELAGEDHPNQHVSDSEGKTDGLQSGSQASGSQASGLQASGLRASASQPVADTEDSSMASADQSSVTKLNNQPARGWSVRGAVPS